MCGGFYVSEANKQTTPCPLSKDPPTSACYAASTDYEGLADSVVVLGSLVRHGQATRGYPQLLVDKAYTAIGGSVISDPTQVTFYKITNTDGACVAGQPCFPMKVEKLNSVQVQEITVSSLTGPDALVQIAQQELMNREIIVVGSIGKYQNNARPFNIVHLFQVEDESLACSTDEDCTYTTFSRRVGRKDRCYCPSCQYFAMNLASAEANADSYDRYCSTYRMNNCPVFRCMGPPTATCNAGRCCCNGAQS
jgi:hypothetical protein